MEEAWPLRTQDPEEKTPRQFRDASIRAGTWTWAQVRFGNGATAKAPVTGGQLVVFGNSLRS